MIIPGLQVQDAEDLALQQDWRPEDSRIARGAQRRQIEEGWCRQHNEATLSHNPADDAIASRNFRPFDHLRQLKGCLQREHTAILVEQHDRP